MTASLQRWLQQFQRHLEHYYALENGPDIGEFVRLGESASREQLLVREDPDGLELALVVAPNQPPEQALGPSDDWAQLIEGVSHFLVISERARRELSTSLLELELQAEIDKFVLLSLLVASDEASLLLLHRKLYEEVSFLHEEGTIENLRYQLANRWAARFIFRMMQQYPPAQWQERLRAFYHAGPTEKLSLLNAA